MKLGEPTKIKNSYPGTNEFIKWFKFKFCRWGFRLPNTKIRGTLGSPAPLWMNNSEKKYKWCFIIELISSLVFIVFFIIVFVYNASIQASIGSTSSSSTNTTSNTGTDTTSNDADCLTKVQSQVNPQFIIIGSSILFINGTI